jgi:hypothetical protein
MKDKSNADAEKQAWMRRAVPMVGMRILLMSWVRGLGGRLKSPPKSVAFIVANGPEARCCSCGKS